MLASPIFLLGATIATFYAALFHLLKGRNWRQVLFYWLASVSGFMLGQGIGEVLALTWPMVGQVHIIPATLGAWLALGLARLLEI